MAVITGQYTFMNLIEDVLLNAKKSLSPEEIWEYAKELKLNDKLKSIPQKPWKKIAYLLYMDIRDNEKSKFYQPSKRPVQFALLKYKKEIAEEIASEDTKEREQQTPVEEVKESEFQGKTFNERDLHPLLVAYAVSEYHFRANLKTIYHENSLKGKKGLNEWLHPDLVAFGIGLIKLNAENIEQSEILLPARINPELDWETVNRLAVENKQFKEFIKDITADITTVKARGAYDEIFGANKLIEYIKNKKIS